jgi:hypothetical protein
MTTREERRLVFGIYPGGAAGGDTGLLAGPPDDPKQVHACLDQLQGICRPFVVRCYDSFQDPGSPLECNACAPLNYAQYAIPGKRPIDLVLQFRSASGNVSGYLDFVRARVNEHHQNLYSIQITEEANFANGPNVIDGPYPNVPRALVEGVVAAKETLRTFGAGNVEVGFNATPTFGPAAEFWSSLKALASEEFYDGLDYVGLDFFPDVFRPVARDGEPGDLPSSVLGVLETMRHVWMPAAGIANHVAIHITEHGWPTGIGRPEGRQSEIVRSVIRTVHSLSKRLNIQRYMLFDLRDVDDADVEREDNKFRHFGITRADYSRKLGFATFQELIEELGMR